MKHNFYKTHTGAYSSENVLSFSGRDIYVDQEQTPFEMQWIEDVIRYTNTLSNLVSKDVERNSHYMSKETKFWWNRLKNITLNK